MKLNARDRAQLVVIAYETGLITPGRKPGRKPELHLIVGRGTYQAVRSSDLLNSERARY